MINTDISIYVPVYNGEKTIEKCVNSILNQTLKPKNILIIKKYITIPKIKVFLFAEI